MFVCKGGIGALNWQGRARKTSLIGGGIRVGGP